VKLIFLDIDGVLNAHHYMREAQSCNICRPCVVQFNRVIKATGAKVVLSSAWRYMVHGKTMSLKGFGYMLRTHGAIGLTTLLVGLTEPDEACPACGDTNIGRRGRMLCKFGPCGNRICRSCGTESTRGRQITAWLAKHGRPDRYVVIDDDDLGITDERNPFVQTLGWSGLSRRKADAAIRILGRANTKERAN
jgi:hypothetical protein